MLSIRPLGMVFLTLLLCCGLCSSLSSTVRAEDGALSVEHAPKRGSLMYSSSLWRTMEPHFTQLSPAWQRRYQELRAIAEDTDTIGRQLAPQLEELQRKFLQAQKSVVFLLLDLAPSTMEAMDNLYLIRRLEEWEWYLADPVRHVGVSEQALSTYAGVLREVGEALARPRNAATPAAAALMEVLPELGSMHALLEARVGALEESIKPWLLPARAMTVQIRTALEATNIVQPRLWLHYYTTPLRITALDKVRAWEDLREMGDTLLRGEIFPRPSFLVVLVTVFVLGFFVLLYRALERNCAAPLPQGAPLWQVLGTELHTQSAARKTALAVGSVCSVNLFLDATPAAHVHIPFLTLQGVFLLLAVAVWAREHKYDPPLPLLWLPALVGYLLLESAAPPLWMVGGLALALLGSAVALGLRQRRSVFYQLWFGLMVAGLLLTLIGFARLTALVVGSALFARAAFVVLWSLYHAKGLRDNPVRISLLMPLTVGWLYSMGVVVGYFYRGLAAIWDYEQTEVTQIFGLQLHLDDVFVLLALGMGLLAFARVSRQFLHRASQQRNLLDSSAVPVIHAVVNSLLWLLFVLFGLGLLGMDMRSLAFIGGALTVGVGLGLQNIISNFFSGLVIIFARVVRGGDMIEVGSVRGRVHSVNMRATVVETLEGAVLLIPNVEMLNSRLANWTRNGRHVREDVRLRLALPTDVEAAMKLMEGVAARCPDVLSSPAPVALLLKSDEGVVDVALQVWVADVDNRRCILSALQTELYRVLVGEGFSLASPVLSVKMEE